ncbi:MAG: histidine phosphatase family protein [Pseudomonadota bacterium]
MKQKYDVHAEQTIDTLNHLLDQGITKCGLLIRHSERFFTDDAGMEPFMGLTQAGKTYAEDLGKALGPKPSIKLCSSFFGRCIETAYLIDKGYTQTHHTQLAHNCTDPMLAPFYIKDIEKAIHMVEDQGSDLFLRHWFDNEIDETIMENARTSADRLCDFMIQQVKTLPENTICICISHDWNIFPIKEFKMGISHESSGHVGYLDGVIFFEKQGRTYVVNYQSDPLPV